MSDSKDHQVGPDDQYMTLAFYIVVDVSYSMVESGALVAASDLLPQVHAAVLAEPILADVVRVGVIDFSDDARVQVRLSDLRDVTTFPEVKERGGTSYAAAFQVLRQEIERDIKQLKADNFKVYRPVVFFITDGQPTDSDTSLDAAFAELTDQAFRYRPNIIPFGVGDATKAALDKWRFPVTGEKQMHSFVAKDGADPAQAINKAAKILISSILASAGSMNDPAADGGFVPPVDEDDDWL